MANVYLGPTGGGIAAELLPRVRWAGAAPEWPVIMHPQTEEAIMSDKSRRWAFFDGVNDWGIAFGYLTLTQLDTLRTLVGLKQTLKFRNDFVDVTEYDVVITAFSFTPTFSNMRGFPRWNADMTLRQA